MEGWIPSTESFAPAMSWSHISQLRQMVADASGSDDDFSISGSNVEDAATNLHGKLLECLRREDFTPVLSQLWLVDV